ncbi:hypothetical protein NAC44_10880 [Allorhizobium sp. BGMRC 0089]|uniref:hypothetical protein n=1 Tax=Allorhizobium sonneratiae TaxID=2934936 RepID=UPI002033A25B|nr:hypothetical protein [Allorhizobium sonneratiae]MCM2292827.1 hypothetical protein [Allorhizobium sonneratiae]
MKKILAACVLGLGTFAAMAAPSLAQDATVIIRDGQPGPRYDGYHDRHHRWHPRHHCRTEVQKFRHHGHWVVKKTTVCR